MQFAESLCLLLNLLIIPFFKRKSCNKETFKRLNRSITGLIFNLLSHEEQKIAWARILRRVTVSDGYAITDESRDIAEWMMG